jgi:acetyl-CoA C-acetyltransferase
MSEDRQCTSGLMAVAIAAKQIVIDGQEAVAGGGMELISLVQIEPINGYRAQGPWLVEHRPDLYMSMLEAAEIVALRYSVTREMQDAYALQSQQRHAAAQAERRPAAEIVPLPSRMLLPSREGENEPGTRDVVLEADEGPRPGTTLADLEKLRHALKDGQELKEGRTVTAGNASQLSDSAAALVLIEAGEAARRGLRPLGAYSRHGRRGVRPGREGHRSRARRAEAAARAGADDGRHWRVGAEGGLREPGAVLPGPARHPQRATS